jgi:predicted lipoprotein with Yx(FWY)xxD motif
MNSRSRILIAALAVVALAAVAIVGTTSSSAKKSKAPATLSLSKTSLGKILVDSKGRTLYELGADGKNKSTCSGACATNWPPAAAPKKPTFGSGVSKSKLKVITRSDGKKQLSYAGHPLYRFIGDSKKGDTNGEGINAFGGFWYVLDGKGKLITGAQGTSTGSGTTTDTTPAYPGY